MPQQKAGDAPLIDPDPAGCGFGMSNSLGPPTVLVTEQQFLEVCDRIEFDRIEPGSDVEARNLSAFIERCDSLRD